ncbi:hypothetical protein WA026_010830 [Henosepilachna vigintioctopunctata]|uniref:Uncharacterized protein n=1 Tax=Henosepilachna vigintioctopunctata TaxID=420089 RepID=A0AAW1UW41_9CUCU
MKVVWDTLEFLFWLFILVGISFALAGFCSTVYIIVYFIQAFVSCVEPISNALLFGIQLPHYCVARMLDILFAKLEEPSSTISTKPSFIGVSNL